MNLQEMYEETSAYVNENIGEPPYTNTPLKITNKFKSAINYAYKKVAREKWMPVYKEEIELDSNLQINISNLNKKFNGIKKIENSDGNEVIWEMVTDSLIECPYEEGTVSITYFYVPDDLSNLNDEPVIPESQVDHKLFCYYAAFQYLVTEEEPDEQVGRWLGLWNEGFTGITQNIGEAHQVKEYW